MKEATTYRATAKLKPEEASEAVSSPFKIDVRFMGGLTKRQQDAFAAAADRWTEAIVGDVPSVRVGGEIVDDVLILAQGGPIDGPLNVLGQAGPTELRPASAGKFAFLPAKGVMRFDSADLDMMEQDGTLDDVITHEMGHVLGIGTIWDLKGLLKGAGTGNPTFVGNNARHEYGTLRKGAATAVPVEDRGGQGTRDSHWRNTVFGNELMTGFVDPGSNPLSRLTIASLRDLGYIVSYSAAEKYSLPTALNLAEAGILKGGAPGPEGRVLPVVPLVLTDDSMMIHA